MTEQEYKFLEEGDIVHFKGDQESTRNYNWTVKHIISEGIMIDSEYDVPMFMDKDEVLDQLEVSKYDKIDSWRLYCDINDKDAWDGEIEVILNRTELALILQKILEAHKQKIIDDAYLESALKRLNIRLSERIG